MFLFDKTDFKIFSGNRAKSSDAGIRIPADVLPAS